jgi:hypothetical protein
MVEDREVGLQSDVFRESSQKACAEFMKRAHTNSQAAEQLLHPFLHFPSGFVSERQREDVIGVNVPFE